MENIQSHFYIKRLLGILEATVKKYDTDKIVRSFEYAAQLH